LKVAAAYDNRYHHKNNNKKNSQKTKALSRNSSSSPSLSSSLHGKAIVVPSLPTVEPQDLHHNPKANKTDATADQERQRIFDKIKLATGQQPGYVLNAIYKLSVENAEVLCDYIFAEQTTFNIAESTKESKITRLTWLALHCNNKPYDMITAAHIQSYLDSGRKSERDVSSHKWMGYYDIKIS